MLKQFPLIIGFALATGLMLAEPANTIPATIPEAPTTQTPPADAALTEQIERLCGLLEDMTGDIREVNAGLAEHTERLTALEDAIAELQAAPIEEPPATKPQPEEPLTLVIPETDIPAGREKAADQAPATDADIANAMTLLRLTATDVFADIGCGDGRVLIAAIRAGAGRAVGVEIDYAVANEARAKVEAAGLSDRIKILTMDAMEFDPVAEGVTAGYVFLWPEQMTRLRSVLDQIPRLASPQWELSWKRWSAKMDHVHVYRPAAQTTQTAQTAQTASVVQQSRPIASVPNFTPQPVVRQRVFRQPVFQQNTYRTGGIVNLPRGSYCQICRRNCSNPMARALNCVNGRCYR